MRRQQIALLALTLWFILIMVYMLLTNIFDLSFFFVLCMIGVLVVMQLLEPRYVRPGYMRYVRFLIIVGILVFGVVVLLKVMEILELEFIYPGLPF